MHIFAVQKEKQPTKEQTTMATKRATYTVKESETSYRVCAMRENIAVTVRYDEKYGEWAVGYAPRDGWWPTLGEAIEAARSIINNK